MASLTQTRLMEYYNYDPETGNFYFNRRPRHEFKSQATFAVHARRVGDLAGSKTQEGYWHLHIDGRYYSAHRLAWLYVHGFLPKYPQFEIDHINGNRSDNRFCNLRCGSKSQNQKNGSQRVNNTSGVHGVNWKPRYSGKEGDGRWVARIWDGPKHVYLGEFTDIEDAKKARLEAEVRLGYTGSSRPPSDEAIKRRWRQADVAEKSCIPAQS